MKRGGYLTRSKPLQRKTIMRAGKRKLVRLAVNLRALDPRERVAARADRIAMRTGKGKLLVRKSTKARKSMTSHARRERFYDYMGWIHTLPCLLGGSWSIIEPEVLPTPCDGALQADHAGDRYRGRAPDSTCVPLCEKHHRERTNHVSATSGAFAKHPAPRMVEWRHAAVEHVQLFALRAGIVVPDDGGRCAAYVRAAAAAPPATQVIPW